MEKDYICRMLLFVMQVGLNVLQSENVLLEVPSGWFDEFYFGSSS